MMPMMHGPRLSAETEWEQLARQLAMSAEQIVQLQTKLNLLWQINDLASHLTSTSPDAPFGDSALTVARAAAIHAMLADFERWLQTPLTNTAGATPMRILFTR